MTALPEVPEWPGKCAFCTPAEYCSIDCETNYERARADAALARLRVAVEALNRASMECVECNGQGQFRSPVNPVFLDDCPACADAREALSTIGEVPPV